MSCCSRTARVAGPVFDGSLRACPTQAQNTLGQQALWAHSISGDLPILLSAWATEPGALIRQALQAQCWRLKASAPTSSS